MGTDRKTLVMALAIAATLIAGFAVMVIASSPGDDTPVARTNAPTAEAEPEASTPVRTTPPADLPALCRELTATKAGRVFDGALGEISGLVRGRRDTSMLWAIEDSGADPLLTALHGDGRPLGVWEVAGASNVDWEDLAIGPPAREGGPARLFIADIGDNQAARDEVTVWIVDEPSDPSGGGPTAAAQSLTLRYPDGPRDAETLLVDPRSGNLLIISKELTGGGIYLARAPLPLGNDVTLQRIADAPLGFETGGDVSADGGIVAVRGYQSLAVWQRRGTESLNQALRRKPCRSPTMLDDGQGETLALNGDGTQATTIAEGKRPPVIALRPAG